MNMKKEQTITACEITSSTFTLDKLKASELAHSSCFVLYIKGYNNVTQKRTVKKVHLWR